MVEDLYYQQIGIETVRWMYTNCGQSLLQTALQKLSLLQQPVNCITSSEHTWSELEYSDLRPLVWY